ncbi:hypothetical protein ACFYPN_25390 [Streptomyces sp. NPDC005576]|uniref:hypothetical protein n=1 Tax=unclassified Streptomyces TaxID=2593676 RepID=UPI00340F3136
MLSRAGRAWAVSPRAVLSAVLILLCCSVGASAAAEAGAMPAPGAPTERTAADGVATARATATTSATLTLAHPAGTSGLPEVRAYAPGGHGLGSSCHGSPGCAAAALPPALASPLALPHPDGIGPSPSPGITPIRGPSDHATQAVDRHRLQIQRT